MSDGGQDWPPRWAIRVGFGLAFAAQVFVIWFEIDRGMAYMIGGNVVAALLVVGAYLLIRARWKGRI